jgi:hypothetical protein
MAPLSQREGAGGGVIRCTSPYWTSNYKKGRPLYNERPAFSLSSWGLAHAHHNLTEVGAAAHVR